MIKFFLVGAIATGLLILAGCSQDVGGADFASSSGSGGNGSLTASNETPLYFSVQTKYANSDDEAPTLTHGLCEIDPANLASNDISCTISVPEGVLRYSETTFLVGTNNAALCPRVDFSPYYRRQSTSATANIFGEDATVDCTGSFADADTACFDGAAVEILGTDFPKYTGVWFATQNSSFKKYTIDPAYSTNGFGNTRVCNNLSAAGRLGNVTVSGYELYEAGEPYVDYSVRCVDPYQGMLFRITIIVQDEDTVSSPDTPGDNEFYDWN